MLSNSELKHAQIMFVEDILEANAYWRKGVTIQYPITPKPTRIEGNPNLYNAFWQDLSEEEIVALRKFPFQINRKWRRIEMAGWQWFKNGMTKLHVEKNGEDINVMDGYLAMGSIDPKGNCNTEEAHGLIPKDQLAAVNFAVVVGENRLGLEHLGLYALANSKIMMPQLSIADKYQHQVIAPRGEVCAFVVKHKRFNIK